MADFSLRPGQSIGEPELSRKLGISRNSTREALIKLETVGFVSRRAGGRWVVFEMSPTDAEEMYECRAALEGLAARRAARLAVEEHLDLRPLEVALDRGRESLASEDFAAAARHSGEFHDGLIEAAGNKKLTSLFESLQPQFRFNRLMMLRHHTRRGFLDENSAILAAVRDGDQGLAQRLVGESADNDLAAVLKLYEQGLL